MKIYTIQKNDSSKSDLDFALVFAENKDEAKELLKEIAEKKELKLPKTFTVSEISLEKIKKPYVKYFFAK